ncbi:hypothetical protein R1flu_014647 [Riccia fluitans]|uniref:Uncharacterized protein n=1 Tax=Riccia fluitans TaxID=41844 RepID=A0ABD1YH29_9MARC
MLSISSQSPVRPSALKATGQQVASEGWAAIADSLEVLGKALSPTRKGKKSSPVEARKPSRVAAVSPVNFRFG